MTIFYVNQMNHVLMNTLSFKIQVNLERMIEEDMLKAFPSQTQPHDDGGKHDKEPKSRSDRSVGY